MQRSTPQGATAHSLKSIAAAAVVVVNGDSTDSLLFEEPEDVTLTPGLCVDVKDSSHAPAADEYGNGRNSVV